MRHNLRVSSAWCIAALILKGWEPDTVLVNREGDTLYYFPFEAREDLDKYRKLVDGARAATQLKQRPGGDSYERGIR
jgi:hypothetical protein